MYIGYGYAFDLYDDVHKHWAHFVWEYLHPQKTGAKQRTKFNQSFERAPAVSVLNAKSTCLWLLLQMMMTPRAVSAVVLLISSQAEALFLFRDFECDTTPASVNDSTGARARARDGHFTGKCPGRGTFTGEDA